MKLRLKSIFLYGIIISNTSLAQSGRNDRGSHLPPIITLPRGQVTECRVEGSHVMIHHIDFYTKVSKRNAFTWTREIADFCNGKGYAIAYPPNTPLTTSTTNEPPMAPGCSGNACRYTRLVSKNACWHVVNNHPSRTIYAEITVYGLMGKAVPTLAPGESARLNNLAGACGAVSGGWTSVFKN